MLTLTLHSDNARLVGFRYFWMKTVTGFRSSVHCANCLVGNYCGEVSNSMLSGRRHVLAHPVGTVLYLCGVASPYRWTHNAHLAMKVDPGHTASVKLWQGDTVEIEGARQLLFDDAVARRMYPDKGRDFLTCRNFQFGAQYFD